MNQRQEKGFTLIELVMVIAIVGILAAIAIPKFIDLSGEAKKSATKGSLGAVRAVLAIRYAQSATGGAVANFPASLSSTDFADNNDPKNALSGVSGVTAASATQTGTTTNATRGFWYVSDSSNANYGKAGAFSDGTVNTSDF